MTGSIYWKLILSSLIVAWAVLNLMPVRETPFPDYIRDHVGAHHEEFSALMEEAEAQVEAGEHPSVYMALRSIAGERRLDIAKFFPDIRIEESMRSIDRRNDVLMAELLRRSQPSLTLGLDLKGGVAFILRVAERPDVDEPDWQRREQLQKAIEIIRSRADGLGVAEPVIRPVGDDRIEVQLPGLTTRDNPEAADALQKPALLEFRLVHRTADPRITPEDEWPVGYEVLYLERYDREGSLIEEPYFVQRIPELTGEAVANAFASMGEVGAYEVILEFTSEGGRRFADLTRHIQDENRPPHDIGQLAIVLDGELYSAPTVQQEIRGGRASITGRFSQREAVELANVLNNPLDLPLELEEMYEVGPTLAADSIRQGLNAALYGAILVVAFMIAYYMFAGIIACLTLGLNLVVILGVLASLGATLTLPGIAGIVLTMGMAVDANILIFERIREELKFGKKLKTALVGGYEKALSTIVDANVTTLLTAFILIFLGAGPVKGFGVTLAIGIFTSMFGALVITRFFLEVIVHKELLKKLSMRSILGETKIDFLKYRKPAFILSWIIVAIGAVSVFVQRDDIYGIDFTGGDELLVRFEQRLSTVDVENAVAGYDLGEVRANYRSVIGEDVETLIVQTQFDRGNEVFAVLEETFSEAGLTVVGQNQIGPAVGAEIQRNAFLAIGISLIGILLYVALRFEMGYAVGAVVATVHDLLMVIGIFVLSGREFNAPMVAGILMVVGYSINDTIVVFDRIREELGLNPGATLKDMVNHSINKVLARTVVTSLTTLLATISLFIFGGGVINDFAFTFIVGILVGTFSSIFIASPVFYWWHKGERRHVEERKDVLPNYEWTASSKATK
ncbi:MAG: protein translocase subunit SecD [Opitutales bacterium]